MTSWVRSRAPSLARIRLTWVLAVGRLTCSVSARSALDSPRATSSSTSRSRTVSSSRPLGVLPGGRARSVKCAMSRRVTLGARSASPAATVRIALSSSSSGRLFSAKPLAPARSASKTYSSRSNVVRMRTRGPPLPCPAVIRRVASMPSITGIRTSIPPRPASSPLRARPPGVRRPPRRPPPGHPRRRSARRTRYGAAPGRRRSGPWWSHRGLDRDHCAHPESPARQPPGCQPPAERHDSLAPPDEPVAGPRPDSVRGSLPGTAVVCDVEADLVIGDGQIDLGAGTLRMPDHVSEGLLDDAVDRQLKRRGQGAIDPGHAQVHRRARGPDRLGQRLDVDKSRSRCQGGHPVLLLAQEPEHDAQLVLGRPADRLYRLKSGAGLLRAPGHETPSHPSLDGDHR